MTDNTSSIDQPLVSVIIPAYNRASLISETLDSVLAQTYSNWECIIVDDGSTDNTVDVIKEYCKKDYRFKLLIRNREPKGAQSCRNIGVINAKGDWIAFQDSDDLWNAEKLEKQTNELKKRNFNPYLVIHSDATKYDVVSNTKTYYKLPLVDGINSYTTLLKHPSPIYPALLTSKKAITEIGYLDIKIPSHQEWDISIRLAKKCEFVHIRSSLVTWVLHNEESISKSKEKQITGYHYIVQKHKEEIIKYCGNEALESHYINLAYRSIQLAFPNKATDYLKLVNQSHTREKWALMLTLKYKMPLAFIQYLKNSYFPLFEGWFILSNNGFIPFIRKGWRYISFRNRMLAAIVKHSRTSIFKTSSSNINIYGNSSLEIGIKPPLHISYPTMLKIGKNATLQIYGNFKIFTGSKIAVLDNACLELGSGYLNINTQIICYKHIKIGYNVAIADGTVIRDSDSHTVIDNGIEKVSTKEVIIGDHVWIGQNCIVLKGVTIGDHAIIAAGSVVTKSIPGNCLAAGNPARVIKEKINWK